MQRALPEQFVQEFLSDMDAHDNHTSTSKAEYDGYRSIVKIGTFDDFFAKINTLYDRQLETLLKESRAFLQLLTTETEQFVQVVNIERMHILLFAACKDNHLVLTKKLLALLNPDLPTVKCGRFIILAAATQSLEFFKSIYTTYPRNKMPRPGAIVAAAVKSQSHDILEFLMQEGFDPNVTDDLSIYEVNYRYNAPMYYAIENADLASINLMIAHGAKLSSHTTHVIRSGNVDILNIFLNHKVSFANVHSSFGYKMATPFAIAAGSNSPAMLRAVASQPDIFVNTYNADTSHETVIAITLKHAAINVLLVLEAEFGIPVKQILRDHLGCEHSSNASLLPYAVESYHVAILKYLFEDLGLTPTTKNIQSVLATAVNESVGGSAKLKVATHCYLYSYCHEEMAMKKILTQAANLPFDELPAETLFILFLEQELMYPLKERYRNSDEYCGIISQMLYTEIAKRKLSPEHLLTMANTDSALVAPAIMYYLCTAGEGFSEQERIALLQSDYFNVNHTYRTGNTPLIMALHHRNIFLIETLVLRGADPDAFSPTLNRTPLTQIRVERQQTDLMLERATSLSNTMRLAITEKCEVLPVKCMAKLNGDLEKVQVGEWVPWLQTAKNRLIQVFNVLTHCNPASFEKMSALITHSNDDDLKEVLDNVKLFKETGKISEKFEKYIAMQREGGVIVSTFFEPCSWGIKVRKEMPTLKEFRYKQ